MRIPLNQFEQYISETILKRGLSYFKNGLVNEPEEITEGIYQAIVEGSEYYTVELEIKNAVITEYDCSCPYDSGPICKHIAAVIFYLQQEALEIQSKDITPDNSKIKKKTKKKTITEQVNEVLEKISHAELKQFIREKTVHDPPFRNIFLSSFAHKNAGESLEQYVNQVKAILRTASDRDGFLSWSGTASVGKSIDQLLASARKQLDNKNYKTVIHICRAVMQEMTKALQFCDDSNGDIGGTIEFAMGLLFEIAGENLPEQIRNELFEYCLTAYEKKIFSDWDWHLEMLQLAAVLLKNEEEAQMVIALLDKTPRSEYEKEEAQSIKLIVIRKIKGEEEADKFIEQNLSNSSLRREAIAKALKNKNYEKAVVTAKEGIKYDQKDRPGLVSEWYDWLLKTAQAQNDKEKIIVYARYLIIDSFRAEQDYYQILKNTVQPKLWYGFVTDLVSDIASKNRWNNFDLIAKIYIKEEWLDKLLDLVKQHPSLSYVEHYEKYLSKDYPDELVSLYTAGVLQYMKTSTGRNHYQTACRYLRRMIKLGGKEQVKKIIADLKRQYPQRRALIEELNLV